MALCELSFGLKVAERPALDRLAHRDNTRSSRPHFLSIEGDTLRHLRVLVLVQRWEHLICSGVLVNFL